MGIEDRRGSKIDVNITGTLQLLEEAATAGVRSFVFTSTTSAFGDGLVPPANAPAAWTPRKCGRRRKIFTAPPRPRRKICGSCSPQSRPAVRDSTNFAVFSRSGRQRRHSARLRRPQRQSQRVSLSPRGYRRRGERAFFGHGKKHRRLASAATSSALPRPLRAKIWPSCGECTIRRPAPGTGL